MLAVVRGEGGCEKIRPRGVGREGEMVVVFVVCKEGAQSRKKFRKSSLMIT